MIQVYIAFPYALDPDGNARRAARIARGLAGHDVMPVVPHLALGFIDEATERPLAMEFCKEWVRRADIFALCGPIISRGMEEELEVATTAGKPVVVAPGDTPEAIAASIRSQLMAMALLPALEEVYA